MGSVQNVDKAFFPLDEELELSTERLTPHAHACLVRYSAIIPSFEKARQELAFALQVEVSEPTAQGIPKERGKHMWNGKLAKWSVWNERRQQPRRLGRRR